MKQITITVTERTSQQLERLASTLGKTQDDLFGLAIKELLASDWVNYRRCSHCGDLFHKSDGRRSLLYRGPVCFSCWWDTRSQYTNG